jgi:hypothetical protein
MGSIAWCAYTETMKQFPRQYRCHSQEELQETDEGLRLAEKKSHAKGELGPCSCIRSDG